MRLSGFGWVHSMNSLLRLCLCLVLVGLITAGAIGCTAWSSTGGMLPGVQVCQAEPLQQNEVDYALSAIGGNEPVIQAFKAAPMVLDTADSAAIYTFKVKNAKNVQINEGGNDIRDISNPTLATLNGTVNGLPASAIQTDGSGKFITVLTASNDDGSVKAELTLSLAANLLPPGLPAGQSSEAGKQTKPGPPKWLDQYSSPVTLTKLDQSNILNATPEFSKCPESCNYCLKPDEAANLGYTQKCSDQPCYYSPDKEKWYCYKPTPGWCCTNGNVIQNTKTECTQIGGFWSTNQSEAIQACQPMGYCCLNGQIYYPSTQAQCAQVGGTWYATQAEAISACQPVTCWCCSGGQVVQTTQAQCRRWEGTCYATQSQATAGCRRTAPTVLTPNLR
jgi:hypothetical protein